jgi:osmotically-inducible protein OsmY
MRLRLPLINKPPDPEIARNAIERLHEELPYSSEFLKLTVKKGWLTFEGDIEWSYQRDRAKKAVRAVRGVTGVSDNLKRQPPVAASDVKRHIEDAFKRSAELDANRDTVETSGSQARLKRLKSWAILDGFSVHRESVGP